MTENRGLGGLGGAGAGPAEILRRDSIGGPDGMILTVRARLLLRNENSAEAEQILRRLLAVSGEERKIYSAEYSYYLAEILARQGKKDEAMKLYAVAAAHSGGSLPLAESNLRHFTKN